MSFKNLKSGRMKSMLELTRVQKEVAHLQALLLLQRERLQSSTLLTPLKQMSSDQIKPIELDEALVPIQPIPRVINAGRLTNRTGETLLVYGPKLPGSTYDNSLYCLPDGYITPEWQASGSPWDCDGFFVPSDRIANQLLSRVPGPAAAKYSDIRFPVIDKSAPNEYNCRLNEGIFKPGSGLNWQIPNITQLQVEGFCP